MKKYIVEEVVETTPEVAPAVKAAQGSTGISLTAIEDDLKNRVKNLKVNTSFTLSESVRNELKERSKKAGISSSEYLDELLKRVFEL